MTEAGLRKWATEEDAYFHHGPSTAQAVLALFARAEAAEAKAEQRNRLLVETQQLVIAAEAKLAREGVARMSATERAMTAEAKLAEAEQDANLIQEEMLHKQALWEAAEAREKALRERVAELEKALRRIEWVAYSSDTYEGKRCPACGVERRPWKGAARDHKPDCTMRAALADKKTGTPCGHMRQMYPSGKGLLPCATPGCIQGRKSHFTSAWGYDYERRAYCCESHPWPVDSASPFKLTSERAERSWGHSVYLWVKVTKGDEG